MVRSGVTTATRSDNFIKRLDYFSLVSGIRHSLEHGYAVQWLSFLLRWPLHLLLKGVDALLPVFFLPPFFFVEDDRLVDCSMDFFLVSDEFEFGKRLPATKEVVPFHTRLFYFVGIVLRFLASFFVIFIVVVGMLTGVTALLSAFFLITTLLLVIFNNIHLLGCFWLLLYLLPFIDLVWHWRIHEYELIHFCHEFFVFSQQGITWQHLRLLFRQRCCFFRFWFICSALLLHNFFLQLLKLLLGKFLYPLFLYLNLDWS